MKIYSNGKDRTLTGSFPARFKLLNNGVEVPFIRTGKGSVRLSGEIPFGELDVEEVIKQKTPQPAKLDAQSFAIINKADFDQIDILNKKLAINQEQMNAHLSALTEHEATLANLETQNAQSIEQTNESMTEMAKVFGKEIQADRERIKATAKSIAQDIAVSSEVLSAKIEAHEKAKNPHKITKETIGLDNVENTSDLDKPVSKATQKALDKKADKSDIEDVRKEIKATEKKQERLVKSIDNANLYGGIGGNELPIGGKTGQILGKKSDKTGDYGWFDNSAKPKWGDIGGNINNQTDLKNALDSKQNVIDDLDTIRAGATAGSTALQPNDDISELNNNVGYITGITSSDVVNALGYTPYDSTNPDDFQTGQEVASAISVETTNRENADIGLQQQIDAITASSDVKDIVGTYAQLQAYDTSTLGNNDIIKVLQDETHSDETTYYRWSTSTETFTLIGEEGPYYTKSEANSTFVPQTRTVNGKALSSDISLNASDVGAQPAGNYMTTDTVQAVGAGATKTFNGRVNFIGEGDSKAIYLSTDTRIDVYGTSRTVLGFANGTFLINNAAYPLNLRGSGARPAWNSTSYLALTSDIGNATLTIQKNGTAVDTFTANATSDKTINITVPTDTGDLTNGAGFITGITSSDVTTALGYTPYNSSNPSGYQENVIETVKVNGTALTPSSKAVDITVPTNNNQLTNGAGYITSSALTGYATETWVGQQGFLTSTALNGYATESWVGQQGYITGITSAMVTTALGYSPVNPTSLASVATSGSYNDLSNKPTIPAAQVNSDWNANSGVAQILNKPTLATVATSGAYSDLSGKPTIPTVNNPTITITQGGVTKGSFTLNQSTGKTIALDAGGGSVNTFNLFDHKWSDYQLNDQSWLRADTFSWQSGATYSEAYNHLVADYNVGTSKTETVGSYTITYKLASDGHKITTDGTNVANIYNESGVAWYYVLDTANQRFKLPRTKYGFVGLRDTVGKYVPESLPNISGSLAANSWDAGTTSNSGPFYKASTSTYGVNSGTNNQYGTGFDLSRASSTYQNNAPVQQRATQMYLYFYVGQFSQSATEQTAGLNSELFNGKADRDLNNLTSQAGAGLNSVGVRTVVETYVNGYSWYRIWSDGWIEQGGRVNVAASDTSFQFLKPFSNADYTILASSDGNTNVVNINYNNDSKYDHAHFDMASYGTGNCRWYACGY